MNEAVADSEADLVVSGLAKTYPGGEQILRDINFTINHSESIALVGSNGSGKSTLIRTLIRLIEPDTGSIQLFGKEVTTMGGRELKKARSNIGFVFQKHNLVPRMSALTNVIHGALGSHHNPMLWFQGFAPQAIRQRAMECLDSVGLAHLSARSVERLSGGESQRVAIARALMQQPRMIFADEPVASLDPKVGEEVMELFVKLGREKNITLLFVSHHLEHALDYADRVIGLRHGVIQFDEASSALTEDDLRKIYG